MNQRYGRPYLITIEDRFKMGPEDPGLTYSVTEVSSASREVASVNSKEALEAVLRLFNTNNTLTFKMEVR